MQHGTITEAEAEAMADKLVWARLQRDPAYRNAENVEAQAEAEERIGRQVWREIEERNTIVQ